MILKMEIGKPYKVKEGAYFCGNDNRIVWFYYAEKIPCLVNIIDNAGKISRLFLSQLENIF